MKHYECANYLHLDCEKGMCAITKMIVPSDGEGSDACPNFKPGFMCQFCKNFSEPNKYGIGTCKGYDTENWAYGQCGAFSCEHFEKQ